MNLPKARPSDILEQDADKELLIYDLRIDRAYTLNETSKIVYKACGNQTIDDLKRQHKFTDDLIHFALEELKANNLIEDYQSNHFAGLTRREVIRKVGLATMVALPVISGIAAPSAVNAASRPSAAVVCRNNNCADGNPACNQSGGNCGNLTDRFTGLPLVCCFGLGSCSCSPAGDCISNGGVICPGIA